MNKVTIAKDLCQGCGLCTEACPKKIIILSDKLNSRGYHPAEVTDPAKCTACAMCALMCPHVIIKVEKE